MYDLSWPLLFWLCAAAIVIAQVQILRSTRRAGATAASTARGKNVSEWVFAIAPIIALGALLWFAYVA